MMTKKDYVRAANICRSFQLPFTKEQYSKHVDVAIADAFAEFFADDNQRFDRERFMLAALGNGFVGKDHEDQ